MLKIGHKLWNFHLGGSSLLEGYLRLISHRVRFINMLRFATKQYLDSGNEGPPKRFKGIPLNSCEAILWGAGTTTTSIATSCRSFQGSRYLQRSHQKTIENMFSLGRKNHFIIATNNHRSLRSSEKNKKIPRRRQMGRCLMKARLPVHAAPLEHQPFFFDLGPM